MKIMIIFLISVIPLLSSCGEFYTVIKNDIPRLKLENIALLEVAVIPPQNNRSSWFPGYLMTFGFMKEPTLIMIKNLDLYTKYIGDAIISNSRWNLLSGQKLLANNNYRSAAGSGDLSYPNAYDTNTQKPEDYPFNDISIGKGYSNFFDFRGAGTLFNFNINHYDFSKAKNNMSKIAKTLKTDCLAAAFIFIDTDGGLYIKMVCFDQNGDILANISSLSADLNEFNYSNEEFINGKIRLMSDKMVKQLLIN